MTEVLGGLPQRSKQKGVSSLGVISTPPPFYIVRDGTHFPGAHSESHSTPTHPGPPEFCAPGTKRTL